MADVTLVLRSIRDEALDTKSFVFDPAGLTEHRAGQYILVKLDVPEDPRKGSRSFSLANAPTEPFILLTTRIRNTSVFKQRLAAMKPGDTLSAKGPLGRFILHDDDRPALLLAGGIGVTPFRSMIKATLDAGRNTSMTLLTSDHVPEAIPYRRELETWAAARPQFHVERTITWPQKSREAWERRTGRIDADWIREVARDLERAVAYASGPPAFVGAMTALLASMGFPPERVRTERFTGY